MSATAVVVFPSPAFVGVTAVTQMRRPSGRSRSRSSTESPIFALSRPYGSTSSGNEAGRSRDLGDRPKPGRLRDLETRGHPGRRRLHRGIVLPARAAQVAWPAMRALVKAERAEGLRLEDVPEPEIGINDVLIRVRKTGICGTDLHIYDWDAWAQETIPVPLVVGHEFVGEVVRFGSNVSDFAVGDLVSGEGHVVCGRCRNCMAGRRHLCAHAIGLGVQRPGAFAEYVALPMTNIWRHEPGIDEEVASIFDPFGNAVHTALSFSVLGEDVLVTGAGPIGCMAVAVVRHAGARHVVVTDPNPYRLELARRMGATLAVDPRERDLAEIQRELGMTEGFDVGPRDVRHRGRVP